MPLDEVNRIHPRVHAAHRAIDRHGELAWRCFEALERCDPHADALVEWLATESRELDLAAAWRGWHAGERQAEPVAALFSDIEPVTARADWRRINRARRLFERTGPFGGFVLALRSLMAGYTSPAGNKPLVFSGRLREQAPRRVAETARFVTAVCSNEGLRSGADGWVITLRVRLMHAQVRRLLWHSGRWDHERWAAPINQHDMLATMLLFSEVYVEGLRIFGFSITEQEADDWLYLWAMVARLLGTEPELLPRDYAEASRLRELIYATQGPPDADSRALAAALLETPSQAKRVPAGLDELRHGLLRAMSRMLIGDEAADRLGLDPAPEWTSALALIPRVIGATERVRVRMPALEPTLRSAGASYWAWVVQSSLGGQPARFARPRRLA